MGTTPQSGQVVNHYRLLEKLGEGGMGVVWLVEDTRLGRRVALKFLSSDAAHDPLRRQRFEQEARAAAGLSHPGIATVHEFGTAGDQVFIVFEYVPGCTLRDLVRPGGLPAIEVALIAAEIATALAAAHARGVVHRDLKPDNVIRTPEGTCKILDFGLARVATPVASEAATLSAVTSAGTVVGTVGYMAPEQLEGKDVDFRADIFSFGTLLYELAAGAHPFRGDSPASTIAAILTSDPVPLTRRNQLQPAELERIARKCLRKRREERYQSTQDLAVDLANVRRDLESGAASPAPIAPEDESSLFTGLRRYVPSIRHWWELMLVWSLIAFCPLAVILGWLVWRVSSFSPGWRNAWFVAVLISAVLHFFLRFGVLLRAALKPRQLAERVAQFALPVRIFTSASGVLALLAAPQLGFDRYPLLSCAAILFGFLAVLYALVVEPMNERQAFPGNK